MEFGLSRTILLATGRRPAGELVADQLRTGLRPGSSYLDNSSNLSATGRKLGLRPARELVADLLASSIVRDRRNSTKLSSSLAGRRPARELVLELRSWFASWIAYWNLALTFMPKIVKIN